MTLVSAWGKEIESWRLEVGKDLIQIGLGTVNKDWSSSPC